MLGIQTLQMKRTNWAERAIFEHRKIWKKIELLKDDRDSPTNLHWMNYGVPFLKNRPAKNPCATSVLSFQKSEQAEQRALSRSTPTHNGERLTGRDFATNVFQYGLLAETLFQRLGLDYGVFAGP